MPNIDVVILKAARVGPIAISLSSLLNTLDVVTARLSSRAPEWLKTELANEGISITCDGVGQWFLESFGD